MARRVDSHKAFVERSMVVKGLPAGTHTIRLEPLYNPDCGSTNEVPWNPCTDTNYDDQFDVTVMEIPN